MGTPFLLLLLLLAGTSRSFFVSHFYDGSSREEFKLGISPSGRLYREEPRMNTFEMEDVKPKRYKPCFYSPMNCMFRRR